MNIALIGKQQEINQLSQEIKENDFFRLLGTYFSDTKALKVNKSSIISPFGLINHSDGVIFQKNDDHSFNLMLEAVKSSKCLIVLNPHELTLEESSELLKVSEEAQTEVFVCSYYKLNPSVFEFIETIKKCKAWEVDAEVGDLHSAFYESAYLIDMIFSFAEAGIRKPNVVWVPFGKKEYITVTLEFDNGKVAVLRMHSVSKYPAIKITCLSEEKKIEIFPTENKVVIGNLKDPARDGHKTVKQVSVYKILIEELSKNQQSEPDSLTRLSDFYQTQKILKSIKEKKELSE